MLFLHFGVSMLAGRWAMAWFLSVLIAKREHQMGFID